MISSDVEMKVEREDGSDGESDAESNYDETDLGLHDDISAQLIAAGPVGLAAAAAIATGMTENEHGCDWMTMISMITPGQNYRGNRITRFFFIRT